MPEPIKSNVNAITALKILNLNPDCTRKAVKKAYRRMALKHHPDKGGQQENFVKVKMAYDYLMKHGTKADAPKQSRMRFKVYYSTSWYNVRQNTAGYTCGVSYTTA